MFKSRQDLKYEIGDMNIDKDILEIRWKAYEDKRKKKINNVMAERKKVIEEWSSTYFTMPTSPLTSRSKLSSKSPSLVESIVEENKDLKRERMEIERIK